MPYGGMFNRRGQHGGKQGDSNQNDSFDNCFGVSANVNTFLDDTNVDRQNTTGDYIDSEFVQFQNINSGGYQTTKPAPVSNNVFYNPFGSFGNKPNDEGGNVGSLHNDEEEQIDEQQGTSISEPAFGGAISGRGTVNNNARNTTSNLYFATTQQPRFTATNNSNKLDFNPFTASQSFAGS